MKKQPDGMSGFVHCTAGFDGAEAFLKVHLKMVPFSLVLETATLAP